MIDALALAWPYLLGLLATGMIAVALTGGTRPGPVIAATVRRAPGTSALVVLLMAASLALGIALTAQERALREGSATATEPFPLIVAAPGGAETVMLATVFLQPTPLPLLDGATFNEIAAAPGATLAAPLAFGDSYEGRPIVGTVAALVAHLSPQLEGRAWATSVEVVVGADVPLALSAVFEPAHGLRNAEDGAHEDELTVVGRMQPTGTAWDGAILMPIEGVWEIHGLANGHAPARQGQLGAPFDARFFPGTGAVIVVPQDPVAAFRLQRGFSRVGETMAFFPGAVLSRLHRILGDVRAAMSVMARVAQVLVGVSVLLTLALLIRLSQRQVAVLRAVGAPQRFVIAVLWGYAMALVSAGAVLGLGLGLLAAGGLGQLLTAQTGIPVTARLGWAEVAQAAAFVALAAIAALIPAAIAARAPIVAGLRS
ncbi:MAG: FtsX-like permease family protein [Shimia sp.]